MNLLGQPLKQTIRFNRMKNLGVWKDSPSADVRRGD
jgi:hypothetical protein